MALAVLTGCSDDDADEVVPEAISSAQQRLLDIRDRAVRQGNRQQFMSTVARDDPAFVKRQRRWFDNVTQLPWKRFRSTVTERTWPDLLIDEAWGSDASVPRVRVVTQLRDYDSAPVTRSIGLAFATRGGVLKVVGDRARGGGFFPGQQPTPWDLTRVTVRDEGGILGLFDRSTLPDADAVMGAVSEGIDQVSSRMPFTWNGRVVVYAFGNEAVLESFDDVPGGQIRHLGAMTFPVHANARSQKVVGLRFTVLPSSIEAGQPFLGRIVRHELTHVAIDHRDDGAPLWFSEGLAEYIGARDVPVYERRIAAVAVQRARSGGTSSMPPSASFNGPEQDWHYALSWMACDRIAEEFGEARLWRLMEEFANNGLGTPDDEQDQVLQRVLGMTSAELARSASARIRSIYH